MALRSGFEDKKQVRMLAILGVGVLLSVGYFVRQQYFSGSAAPAPTPAKATAPMTPLAPPSASAPASGGAAKKVGHINLDPTLHSEWMAQAESLAYTGRGRNIFSQTSAPAPVSIPKPKISARPTAVQNIPQGPPPPPPPPPIDLKFFGFAQQKSGAKKVFLLHGEDIFIAAEGEIVNRRYKVVKIMPFAVQVEDVAYKNTQSLPLIQR